MNKRVPLKRHTALQPLSHDHHQGLLLCWKIRTGFELGVDHERMKRYTDWFWENHLLPHFIFEEINIFPILGEEHPMVKRALSEHHSLKELFTQSKNAGKALIRIEKLLEQHIRYEERVMFGEIQKIASEETLREIENLHQPDKNDSEWEDPFWVIKK